MSEEKPTVKSGDIPVLSDSCEFYCLGTVVNLSRVLHVAIEEAEKESENKK